MNMANLDVNIEFEKENTGQSEEQVFITKTFVRSSGYIYKETTLNGLLHAGPMGEPSAATFDPDGYPLRHAWHAFGEYHRIDGPAKIDFHHRTDKPMTERFMIDGKPRPPEVGPFRICWNDDGTLWREEFAEPSRPQRPTRPMLEP